MKKIWIARVETEDGEKYYYCFESQPSENQVKEIFFEDEWNNYDKSDWGVCISHYIDQVTLYLDK